MLVPIAPHDLSNRPIVLPDTGEIRIEIVAGRDASVNFDMQSLASLLHGDRVRVRRSAHQVRFLHPRGWSYYATLRRKLHWDAGVAEPSACCAASSLRDFVIVAALEVEFGAGFTVLTGETGAGKSILIDALQLALGSRGDAGVVREGAARAEIAAEFDTPAGARRLARRRRLRAPATTRCCCAARSTRRARAARGSTAARPRSRSCARPPSTWSTSTASTPGRA